MIPTKNKLSQSDQRMAEDIRGRCAGVLGEHLMCWQLIGLKLDAKPEQPNVIYIGEGMNKSPNREMMEEAVLMLARQILLERQVRSEGGGQ